MTAIRTEASGDGSSLSPAKEATLDPRELLVCCEVLRMVPQLLGALGRRCSRVGAQSNLVSCGSRAALIPSAELLHGDTPAAASEPRRRGLQQLGFTRGRAVSLLLFSPSSFWLPFSLNSSASWLGNFRRSKSLEVLQRSCSGRLTVGTT